MLAWLPDERADVEARLGIDATTVAADPSLDTENLPPKKTAVPLPIPEFRISVLNTTDSPPFPPSPISQLTPHSPAAAITPSAPFPAKALSFELVSPARPTLEPKTAAAALLSPTTASSSQAKTPHEVVEIKSESGVSETPEVHSVWHIPGSDSESSGSLICLNPTFTQEERLTALRRARRLPESSATPGEADKPKFIDDPPHSRKRASNKLDDCQEANPTLTRQRCWEMCVEDEHARCLEAKRGIWNLGACPRSRPGRRRASRAAVKPEPILEAIKTEGPVKKEEAPEPEETATPPKVPKPPPPGATGAAPAGLE